MDLEWILLFLKITTCHISSCHHMCQNKGHYRPKNQIGETLTISLPIIRGHLPVPKLLR